jgi:capsular polysaccharide biosynthesis protein
MKNKKILQESQTILRNKPINLKKNDIHLFEHELNINSNCIFFYKLKNVLLVDDTIVTLPFFKFYPGETHINGSFSRENKFQYLKKISFPTLFKKKAIWITQNWTWMYFHWLTDALPRYVACLECLDEHLVILPDSYAQHPFIVESLIFLGIPYFFHDKLKTTFVSNLILPGHTSVPGNYNIFLINKLRSMFHARLTFKKATRKVFISRSKAGSRRISNQEEFDNLLLKYGYEIHCLEDYSFIDQIKLMYESTHLIGVHGGGLTNMLFCQQDAKVMEIRMKDDNHNNCYFSLASALNIPYFYFEAEIVDSSLNTLRIDTVLIEIELGVFSV